MSFYLFFFYYYLIIFTVCSRDTKIRGYHCNWWIRIQNVVRHQLKTQTFQTRCSGQKIQKLQICWLLTMCCLLLKNWFYLTSSDFCSISHRIFTKHLHFSTWTESCATKLEICFFCPKASVTENSTCGDKFHVTLGPKDKRSWDTFLV